MKRKTFLKIALGLLVTGIISAALVYHFVINKPHRDFEKAKPSFIVSASDLFESFRADRTLAESKYNGQVVLLSGKLDMIEASDNLVTGVFVFDEGLFGDEGVRCTMLPEHAPTMKSLPIGSEVSLKGFLTGYNETDVILEHCSFVR
jgi:hypothetical protein